jgi:hypothetical protein
VEFYHGSFHGVTTIKAINSELRHSLRRCF